MSVLMRLKATGEHVIVYYELGYGDSGYRAADTGKFYEADQVEPIDCPGAKWCECTTCGYRWVEGMHGGHSCSQNLRTRLTAAETENTKLKKSVKDYQDNLGDIVTFGTTADVLDRYLREETEKRKAAEERVKELEEFISQSCCSKLEANQRIADAQAEAASVFQPEIERL